MHRIACSFLCTFVGWVGAYAHMIFNQVHGPGFGYVTDFYAMLFWPALFTFIAWLVFIVPTVGRITDLLPRMRAAVAYPLSVALGGLTGAVFYALLVCTWASGAWSLIEFPIIVGAISLPLMTFILRGRFWLRNCRLMTSLVFAVPPLFVLGFAFVVWPLVVRYAPYVAFVYGDWASREQAHCRILKTIRTGDSFSDLHSRYPRIFPSRTTGISGASSSGFTYDVTFDSNGIQVVHVRVSDVACTP